MFPWYYMMFLPARSSILPHTGVWSVVKGYYASLHFDNRVSSYWNRFCTAPSYDVNYTASCHDLLNIISTQKTCIREFFQIRFLLLTLSNFWKSRLSHCKLFRTTLRSHIHVCLLFACRIPMVCGEGYLQWKSCNKLSWTKRYAHHTNEDSFLTNWKAEFHDDCN